jgi:hypothetical protein
VPCRLIVPVGFCSMGGGRSLPDPHDPKSKEQPARGRAIASHATGATAKRRTREETVQTVVAI